MLTTRSAVRFCLLVASLLLTGPLVEAAEPKKTPAVFEVAWMKSRPIEGSEIWIDVPEFLKDCEIYDVVADDRPQTVPGNEISLTVKELGTLLLTTSWGYDGNKSGGWAETRTTEADLLKQGWKPVGSMKRSRPNEVYTYTIFRKEVAKGDVIKFHSRKYNPPLALAIKPETIKLLDANRDIIPSIDITRLTPATEPAGRANDPKLVMLTTRDTPDFVSGAEKQVIGRELVRQAILLAAREELGAATRDETLREPFPQDETGSAPFEVVASLNAGLMKVTIFRQTNGKFVPLWDKQIVLPLEQMVHWPDALTAILEELIRTEFGKVLKANGVDGNPNKYDPAGEVPAEIANAMQDLTFVPQINALRNLHKLMQTEGESAARLAAVARGYAHLGTLTENLWSTAHKAFKARALLYAERLVFRTEQSPMALATRAYVRALVGRPGPAQADIAKARELAGDGGITLPTWVPVIDAYCMSDRAPLMKASTEGDDKVLARYLLMLTHEELQDETLLLQDVASFAELIPDSMRAMEMLLTLNTLGVQRTATQSSLFLLLARWPVMFGKIDGLSEELQDSLKETLDALQDRQLDLAAPADFAHALRQAGSQDRHEPSLAVPAQLLEDWAMLRAWWIVHFEKFSLGVSPNDTIAQLRPLFENHRHGLYIECETSNYSDRRRLLKELLPKVNTADVDWNASAMMFGLAEVEGGEAVQRFVYQRFDQNLYRDMLAHTIAVSSDSYKQSWTRQMRLYAPEMRGTIGLSLKTDWEEYAKDHAAEWEQRFAKDPYILSSLSKAYSKANRPDDAIRCLKQQIELAPDIASYRALALIYYEQKDYAAWLKTQELALEQPSLGLELAQIHAQIADYYMERGQFEKAKPHANEAASSYAFFGLKCGAECYSGLEDWETAEDLMRAIADRYDTGVFAWHRWCVYTGHGDRKEASRAVHDLIEDPNWQSDDVSNAEMIGAYFDLIDDHERAIESYRTVFKNYQTGWCAIEAALIADQLGKKELRDELLALARANKNTSKNPASEIYGKFAGMLADDLAKEKPGEIDLDAMRKFIAEAHQAGQPWFAYLTGQYLGIYGKPEASREFLQQAATSSALSHYAVTFARNALRKQKIEIQPIRYLKDE